MCGTEKCENGAQILPYMQLDAENRLTVNKSRRIILEGEGEGEGEGVRTGRYLLSHIVRRSKRAKSASKSNKYFLAGAF